jgi:uncharacterized integral membrane protein
MENRKDIGGIILIILGVIFFLKNFINIPGIEIKWNYIWPIILIIVGIIRLWKK